VENGEEKGVVVDVVGNAKEEGRAGTEGRVVLEDDVEPALEAGRAGAGVGVEVTAAGVGGVDVVAVAAAMVPLRSHGFGGEAIVQIGGSRVHRNYHTESGISDKMYVQREQPMNVYFESQTEAERRVRGREDEMGKERTSRGIFG
jgi:hypothetical protein